MKKILYTLVLLVSCNYFGQNMDYDGGFRNGFNNGYCYNNSLGCLSPIPPITPLPNPGELFTYQNGYNKGFISGRDMKLSESNTSIQDKSPYGAKKYLPEIKPFIPPNYSAFQKSMQTRERKQEESISASAFVEDYVKRHNNYYSPEKNIERRAYADLIRNYYKSFSSFPTHLYNTATSSVILDVIIIVKSQDLGGNLFAHGTEVISGRAKVYQNKIEMLGFDDKFYGTSTLIFKRGSQSDLREQINLEKNLLDDYSPLNMSRSNMKYFIDDMNINKCKSLGESKSEFIGSMKGLMKGLIQPTIHTFEVYFIDDLDRFNSK
jgi:hypothetical protein